MKPSQRHQHILLPLSLLLTLLLIGSASVRAQDPKQLPTDKPQLAQEVGELPAEYLFALPVLPPEDVPADLSPDQATEYARHLTLKQAEPLLAEIEKLQAMGAVTHFETRPELHGVIVSLAQPGQTLLALRNLLGGATIIPKGENWDCARDAAEALREQALAASRVAERRSRTRDEGLSALATNPSIFVYRSPYGNYGYIYGQTTANTAVTMVLYRPDDTVRVTRTTTSDSNGYYYFWPSWHSCPTGRYDWYPYVGDTVQVTVEGNTVRTVVASLSAWVDPVANTVSGLTAPGRSVEVTVYHYSSLCFSTPYRSVVGTNASGAFQASFGGIVDFDRLAWAEVHARDANGNSTYSYFAAYRLGADFGGSHFWGYMKPNIPFTAHLKRGGAIVSSFTGKTDATNYFSGGFGTTVQAGDVIEVRGADVAMSYTATSLTDLALDHYSNRATGITGPGRRVGAGFYKNTDYPAYNGCNWDNHCAETTADGSGRFALDSGFDLERGDYAYLYIYDAEGNYQTTSGRRNVPLISTSPGSSYVDGVWKENSVYLNAVLRQGATIKSTASNIWVSSYDALYSLYFSTSVQVGDQIDVGDGAFTTTMTVQDVTARVDSSNDIVYGRAPAGSMTLRIGGPDCGDGYWRGECRQIGHDGGAYSLGPFSFGLNAWAYADVYFVGPDGHQTYAPGRAFSVGAAKGGTWIYGYTVEPGATVDITLRDSALGVKSSASVTSDSWGWFGTNSSATIAQGDRLSVSTSDGWSAQVIIPELTVNADPANNRLYGRAPANRPVVSSLRRWDTCCGYWYYSSTTMSDGGGNYSASFTGLYWSYDCQAMHVGGQCTQPAVYYYDTACHEIWAEGEYPSYVNFDAYEDDDDHSRASAYTGLQHHSFHEYPDDDWVRFTVSADDMARNVSYYLATLNLGVGTDTVLTLYAGDGTTELAYDDDSGPGLASLIVWKPSAAGTYYLKARPFGQNDTAYCGALYDLLIYPMRYWLYVPLALREYEFPYLERWCDPYESNDDRWHPSGPLASGQAIQAKLCQGDPQDNYYLDATMAGSLQIRLQQPTTLVNHPALWVYPADDLAHALPNCGGGPLREADYRCTCSLPRAGRYVVSYYSDGPSDDLNPYTLQVTYQ